MLSLVKKMLLAVTTVTAVSSIASAHAAIVEINELERVVYVHPTPTATVTVMDLGRDGGALSVLVDYNDSAAKEIREIEKTYPDFEVKVLQGLFGDLAQISIPLIEFSKSVGYMQGQVGPIVNAYFDLSTAQVATLKKSTLTPDQLLNITTNVKVSYQSKSLVERYKVDSRDCSNLTGENLSELFKSAMDVKKPNEIIYDETFSQYRNQLMAQCFELRADGVSSFAQLLTLPVSRAAHPQNFEVKYSKSVQRQSTLTVKPLFQFSIVGD